LTAVDLPLEGKAEIKLQRVMHSMHHHLVHYCLLELESSLSFCLHSVTPLEYCFSKRFCYSFFISPVILVGIGSLEAAQKFSNDLNLEAYKDRIALVADETGAVTHGLGCYRGWLTLDPTHAARWRQTQINPYIRLLGMISGFGSPGTIGEVLYGYVGDWKAAKGSNGRKWVVDSLLQGSAVGRFPKLTDKAFEGIDVDSSLRAFELATLRLQTGLHIVFNWKTLGPKDGNLFTRMGGTFVFQKQKCLWSHFDRGILTYADMDEVCNVVEAAVVEENLLRQEEQIRFKVVQEEQARLKAIEEEQARLKAEVDARMAEEERLAQEKAAEKEAILKAEGEARMAEEERLAQEKAAEEEARLKAEGEARMAEEERLAQEKAAEEEAIRLMAEGEARIAVEEIRTQEKAIKEEGESRLKAKTKRAEEKKAAEETRPAIDLSEQAQLKAFLNADVARTKRHKEEKARIKGGANVKKKRLAEDNADEDTRINAKQAGQAVEEKILVEEARLAEDARIKAEAEEESRFVHALRKVEEEVNQRRLLMDRLAREAKYKAPKKQLSYIEALETASNSDS
jgi:hypothetical protein